MVILTIKNVYSKIECDRTIFSLVRGLMRIKRDFNRFGNETLWGQTEYEYLINEKGVFLTGMIYDIIMLLKQYSVEYRIDDQRVKYEILPAQTIEWNFQASEFSPRDYQLEAFLKAVEYGRGLFDIATGGGKGYILSLIVQNFNMKTCILISNGDLFNQLRAELASYMNVEIDEIGYMGAGKIVKRDIMVCMTQTINGAKSKSKKQQINSILSEMEMVIVDEAHHAQASTFQSALKAMPNAFYRFGFTATPIASEMFDINGQSFVPNAILKAWFGPVLMKLSTKDLIQKGFLAKPTVRMINNILEPSDEILDYNTEYTKRIVNNEERNQIAADIILSAYQTGKQAICFVDRLDHGHNLMRLLESGIPESDREFVTGEDYLPSRSDKIAAFKAGNLPVLIGTVLSEGLNSYCDVGVNPAAGKSEKTVIQRVGRILRKKPTSSGDVDTQAVDEVDVYDFLDLEHPFFRTQARKRREIYNNQGHDLVIEEIQ